MAVNSNATTPCFPLQPSSDEAAAAAAARANTAAAAAEGATEDASQAASDANDAKDAADAAVEAVNAKLALVQTLEEIYGGAYVNEQVSGSTINITDGADNVPVKALSVAISGASPALTAVTINKTVNGLNTPYTMTLESGGEQLSVTEGTLDFVNGVLVSGGVTYNIDGGGIDVPTSLGANTFTTSAGVMDMTYRADIDLYLQETYLALANLENAVVGNAKQLVATVGINDNAPYLFRTSGGTADIGDRETDEIVGGTVAWNQLFTAETEGTSTIAGDVTRTVANHKITLSGIATENNFSVYKREIPVVNGHKYLVLLNTSGTTQSNSTYQFYTAGDLTSIYQIATPKIIEAISSGSGILKCAIYSGATISATIDEPCCSDLTHDFGSAIADYVYGLEQATAGAGIAWLRKYGFFTKPYYPYNAGGLLSVKTSAHKMVGFNQADKSDFVIGKYVNPDNGTEVTNSTYNCSGFIRVVPNTVYHTNMSAAGDLRNVVCFDADKNYISAFGYNATTHLFTTPENCAYIRLNMKPSAVSVDEAVLNIHWDGERDGEYKPYEEWVYPLDATKEWRGIFKLDANNNLYADGDIYPSSGQATRKYDVVDLGTLDYILTSHAQNTFDTGIVATNNYSNAICSKYVNIGIQNYEQMADKTIQVRSNRLYIKDSTYTDAATFKTAMSGVYLVYERATPTTESAEPYTNPQIVDDFGTEEYIDEREVPIPVGHNTIYSANLRAKLEMAPDSPDGDGDYIVRQTNGTNEYVPLPVSNVYQHNLVITLSDSAGTIYMPYVSKLATAINIVDIGSTTGAPTTTPIYPATGYYDSKAVVAVQFGVAPAITVYLADGTNASTTMTALVDTVG